MLAETSPRDHTPDRNRSSDPQGSTLSFLLTVSFPPESATFDSVLLSIIDITERRRSERALEELAGRLIHARRENAAGSDASCTISEPASGNPVDQQ
jgi:hypothetical protein